MLLTKQLLPPSLSLSLSRARVRARLRSSSAEQFRTFLRRPLIARLPPSYVALVVSFVVEN
jgi:hypothetical protein